MQQAQGFPTLLLPSSSDPPIALATAQHLAAKGALVKLEAVIKHFLYALALPLPLSLRLLRVPIATGVLPSWAISRMAGWLAS